MTQRRLLLLRHGRTEWNARRRFQGQLDPPLDEVGRAQAYEVGAIVAAVRPDLMVSSDLTRARQTAEIVGQVAGLSFDSAAGLRERGLGHWEGLTRDEVAEQYPAEFAQWTAGRDVSSRGGETREQVAARALAVLRGLSEVPIAVLVTHGATAMALTNALLGIDQAVHPLGPLANCHWSELTRDTDGWRLRGHNLGAPGAVVPLPMHAPDDDDEQQSDADA